MNYASIGTVSHGTLRTEDLLDAFADTLEDCVQRNAEEWCSDEGRKQRDSYLALITEARERQDYESDEAIGLVTVLGDTLEDFAAPYCYFGSTEGDGSDFGFWPSIESLEEAVADGEVLKVSDTSAVTPEMLDKDWCGLVMLVNDHGNVTLYQVNGQAQYTELWSCV